MYFTDRTDAGRQLADALKSYKGFKNTLVLAIPRGGVVIGYVIAKELGLPLEVELIKKIGHPYNSELAIGAVSLKGRILTTADAPPSYIENETERIRELLQKRYDLYSRHPVDCKGKTVIIVDDGIATGSTLLATIDLIKECNPEKIVVAVPVAPPRTVNKVARKVDEVVCLKKPSEFFAIGQFYEKFDQVSDKEVIRLLNKV